MSDNRRVDETDSRTAALPGMGAAALDRLASAQVLVVGAGGLGSPVLQYLAASGVGRLGVVDDDRVELHNLQRQVIHGRAQLGMPKTQSAVRALGMLNPAVLVTALPVRLSTANALDILRDWDVIVDASDNLPTRYLISDAAALLGRPTVWGSVLRYEGQVSVFWDAAPGGGVDYRDLHPVPPDPRTVLDCAEAGVLGPLCGVIGSAMAVEVVKLVTGVGEPLLGRVLHHDARAGTWETIPVRRSPTRDRVTGLVDYDGFCGIGTTGASDAIALDEAGDRIPLDVRSAEERSGGHLPGDRWVPVDRLVADVAAAGAGRFLVYCASGVRSERAVAALRSAGVDAVSLRGGWRPSPAGERGQHIDRGALGRSTVDQG